MTKWGKTVEGKPATPDNVINFVKKNGGDANLLAFRELGVQRGPKSKVDYDYIERKMAEEDSCIIILSKETQRWYLVNFAESNHYEGYNTNGEKAVLTYTGFSSLTIHEKYVRDFFDLF
jgi:hypothetical protein